MTEILLKVALNTIKQTSNLISLKDLTCVWFHSTNDTRIFFSRQFKAVASHYLYKVSAMRCYTLWYNKTNMHYSHWFSGLLIEWVSERLLHSEKWAMFQPYHGENKLLSMICKSNYHTITTSTTSFVATSTL